MESPPEQIESKRVRKLKVIEVKPRRRYLWAGPAGAVFVMFLLVVNIPTTSGSTIVSKTPTGEGTNAWTNPTYARTSNDQYATAAPAKNGNIAGIWGTYAHTDPGGTTIITKVEIGTEHKVSTTSSIATLGRQCSWNGGTTWSTDTYLSESDTEKLTDTTYWLDVTSATSWSWAKLNDANLQVRITAKRGNSVTGVTFSLDASWVRVTYDVHHDPTLTADGVTPSSGNPGTYTFFVTYNDADGDAPSYMVAHIDSSDYAMTKNDSGDSTPPICYYYEKAMTAGTHTYDFEAKDAYSGEVTTGQKNLIINNLPTLSGFSRAPGDPVYVTDELNFTMTFTDLDNTMPSSIKWMSGADNLTMSEVDPSDTTTSDGKEYYLLATLTTHGEHNYDYGASDGQYWTTGGSDSVTIANRAPDITNGPGAHVDQYRNVPWYYVFTATDADSDTVDWEMSGPGWLSINSGGNLSGTTSDTPGEYSTTVYANDSYSGSDSYAFTLHINNQNPVISSTGNTTQDEGTYLAYEIIASDPDGDTLSYALSSNATWASIDGPWVNGTAIDPGWYEFTVWANDSYSGSDLEHWHLTVEALAENLAPYFTSEPSLNISRNHTYTYDANATDPEAASLYYDLTTNSTLVINSTTGVLSILIQDIGSFWVNVSVSDGENTVYQNFTIDSYNEPPYIITIPPTIAIIGEPYLYEVEAVDNNSDPLTYGLTDSPEWLSIDPITGEVSGVAPIIEEGAKGAPTYDVHIEVWDGFAWTWQNYSLELLASEEVLTEGGGPFTLSIGVMVIIALLAATMVMIWRGN